MMHTVLERLEKQVLEQVRSKVVKMELMFTFLRLQNRWQILVLS
jgi:hypothetical protein